MKDRKPKAHIPDTNNYFAVNPRKADVAGDVQQIKVAVQGELFSHAKPSKPWMRPYNGFSWAERCAVTPIQNKALSEGRLKRPTMCSICLDDRSEYPKGRDYRFLHTEDYTQPLVIYSACKRCHAALHARFNDPERWMAVAKANWRQGAWFTRLSMDPTSQFQPFDITYPIGFTSLSGEE